MLYWLRCVDDEGTVLCDGVDVRKFETFGCNPHEDWLWTDRTLLSFRPEAENYRRETGRFKCIRLLSRKKQSSWGLQDTAFPTQ